MKKYLQITFVLGIFGLLVFFRQLKGSDAQPVVMPPQSNNTLPAQEDQVVPAATATGNTTQSTSGNTTPSTGSSTPIYKDGTYTGPVTDAFYGNYQVQAVINRGKISDIIFLKYPNDNPTSRSINQQASVFLKEEALAAQSASVDIVSGASDSSQAFRQSLAAALSQAK